jgi:hypothetical protein
VNFSETSIWASLRLYPALNTPSQTSFSPTGQIRVPWTGFSLTLAVSWMLLLAFSAPSGVAEDSVEEEAARAERAAGTEVPAVLYSSSLEGPPDLWSWQTELLAKVSTTNE